jgi:hypothetical protein
MVCIYSTQFIQCGEYRSAVKVSTCNNLPAKKNIELTQLGPSRQPRRIQRHLLQQSSQYCTAQQEQGAAEASAAAGQSLEAGRILYAIFCMPYSVCQQCRAWLVVADFQVHKLTSLMHIGC